MAFLSLLNSESAEKASQDRGVWFRGEHTLQHREPRPKQTPRWVITYWVCWYLDISVTIKMAPMPIYTLVLLKPTILVFIQITFIPTWLARKFVLTLTLTLTRTWEQVVCLRWNNLKWMAKLNLLSLCVWLLTGRGTGQWVCERQAKAEWDIDQSICKEKYRLNRALTNGYA